MWAQMIIFTFCVDISRFSTDELSRVANILVNSLEKSGTSVDKFIIYTNFELDIINSPSYIEIRQYNQQISDIYTDDDWLNLSLNKLAYYEMIMQECGKSPIWLDLDTIVCRNIDHLDGYPNFFLQIGTEDRGVMNLLNTGTDYLIPRNEYLQGNVFKLNKELLDATNKYVNRFRDSIVYDHQGAFNLVYHFMADRPEMLILGRDVDKSSINSFEVWNVEKGEHPNEENVESLFINSSGNLMSKLHPDKEVQFISFTFRTYLNFLRVDRNANALSRYLHSFESVEG